MAPFTNIFHTQHPLSPTSQALHPIRFLGQLLDEPHHSGHRYSSPRRHHRQTFLAPDFDVRETEGAYYLEGELAGIADKEAVKLEWVDGRTLAIDAEVRKVDLVAEWDAGELKGKGKVGEGEGADGAFAEGSGEREEAKENGNGGEKGPKIRDWLCERRIGHYQRTFTFPAEVNADGVRARLGQGLLRVMVPKVKETEIKAKKVNVENVEGIEAGLGA